MNCKEVRQLMSRWVDGQPDSSERKKVSLHLADCSACMEAINEDNFWNDAVLALLHREAPADLRSDILSDLDSPDGVTPIGWRKKLKIAFWFSCYKKPSLRMWLETIALVVGILWLMPAVIKWWSSIK